MLPWPWLCPRLSDGNAIRYVLSVLWMTSCLPIVGYATRGHATGRTVKTTHQRAARIPYRQSTAYAQSDWPGRSTGGEVMMSTIALFVLL